MVPVDSYPTHNPTATATIQQSMRRANTQYAKLILVTLLLLLINGSTKAESISKKLKELAIGIDSTALIEQMGQPTYKDEVTRWFYNTDQVVIINGKISDIRLSNTSHKINIRIKRDKSKRNEPALPISHLRIGMDTKEAYELAGDPDSKIEGADWYYTKRHRVELSQGKVERVDLHLRASLDTLDWIRLNFTTGGLLFMNITLAFIMFGVALEIKFESFRNLAKNPKPVIVGVISQFIALPALTFLLVLIIKPSPSVAMGMILVAACPGGNISNFISSLAKGNVALSVSLTAVATLSAIFLTPFNFAFWGSLYSEASDLVIPFNIDAWEMIKTVFILLGIPIIVGLWFARKFPQTTEKIKKPMKWFSILFFFGFVVAALASNFSYFLKFIHLILLIVLAHNALALLTGFSIASLFRLPRADRRTITIETGIQNSGLGLVLIFNPNLFNGLGGMAFIAAWWGIWHILSGMSIASLWARKPLND